MMTSRTVNECRLETTVLSIVDQSASRTRGEQWRCKQAADVAVEVGLHAEVVKAQCHLHVCLHACIYNGVSTRQFLVLALLGPIVVPGGGPAVPRHLVFLLLTYTICFIDRASRGFINRMVLLVPI